MSAEICAFGAVEDFRLEDLRSEIYPQCGPDCDIVVLDIVVNDVAVTVDKCSMTRILAGRPQPPYASSIVASGYSLRKAISGSITTTPNVRTIVLIHLGNAKEENFVGRIVAG